MTVVSQAYQMFVFLTHRPEVAQGCLLQCSYIMTHYLGALNNQGRYCSAEFSH